VFDTGSSTTDYSPCVSDSAQAQAEAAEANEKAERESLARAKIEARLRPRTTSLQESKEQLREAIRPWRGANFWIIVQTGEDRDPGSEQLQFGSCLSDLLVSGGWAKADPSQWTLSKTPLPLMRRIAEHGIELGYPRTDRRLRKAAETL
jgi:hypothetical protein